MCIVQGVRKMCARCVQDMCKMCARCVQDMCKMCARCAKDVCKICKKVDSFVPRPDPDIPLDPAHRVEKKEADNRFNTGNDTYWQGIFWYIFKRPKTVIGQYRSSNLFYVLLLAHNLNHIMMAINNLCHFLSAAVLLIILILDQRWKVAGRCWVLGGSLVRHADGENEVGIGWTSKHGPMITFPLFLI